MTSQPVLVGPRDRYQLSSLLGRGSSGVTWRATRLSDGAAVCAKELRWATMGDLDDERRFQREADILAGLHHDRIPALLDHFAVGEGAGHALWLVQELVPGTTLEVERQGRGYAAGELHSIARELAGLLAYLHERHPPVVHRDLKPGNVMRRPDGRLVLLDFGAALLAGIERGHAATVAGTFGFMAPEQIRGEAGPASDVYALGMLLLVLATGAPAESLLDDANRPDLARAALAPEVERLIAPLLALDPRDRPRASTLAAAVVPAEAAPVPRRELTEPPPLASGPEARSLTPEHARNLAWSLGIGLVVLSVALALSVPRRQARAPSNGQTTSQLEVGADPPQADETAPAPTAAPEPLDETPPVPMPAPEPLDPAEAARREAACRAAADSEPCYDVPLDRRLAIFSAECDSGRCARLADYHLALGHVAEAWQVARDACARDRATCQLAARVAKDPRVATLLKSAP
ncbi:MAG: serine/threonine-protein kinase [Myxococcota bacterium]